MRPRPFLWEALKAPLPRLKLLNSTASRSQQAGGLNRPSARRASSNDSALPSKEALLRQAAELQRQQAEVRAKVAELAQLVQHLSTEERAELQAHIQKLDAGLAATAQAGGAEEDGYPDSVTALLKAAGVLHAVPLGAERFVQDSDEQYSLPDPPRFHFSDNGAVDTGEEDLTDEDWAQIFQPGSTRGCGAPEQQDDSAPEDPGGFEDFEELPYDDDVELPGDNRTMEARPGVERFLALLEAGQALPPDPREAGKTREDAAAFVARMERIVARYEAQHLKRAEWQIDVEELRDMEVQWADMGMTSPMPTVDEDITEVVPAPDIPPAVEQQWHRAQWILYRLRRAYLDGPPTAPVQALASAGLLAEGVAFSDAVVQCLGIGAWMEYCQRAEDAGGFLEIRNLWGNMSPRRPDPQWHIVVDSWLSLPYPEWYMDYFLGHLEPSRHPLAFLGAFAAATTDAAAGDPAAAPVQEEDGAMRAIRERMQHLAALMAGPGKPKLEDPLLNTDVYRGRPLSMLQRLRSGALPVLERDPSVSIDDLGDLPPEAADQAAQEQQPSPLSSILDFVTDPGRREAPLAICARDAYGGGRQLLLPLFRSLQARAAAHLARSSRGARSGSRQHPHAVVSAERARGLAACDAGEGDASAPGRSSKARYGIDADEAVRLARDRADAWRRERAEHLSADSGAGPAEGAEIARAAMGAQGKGHRSVSKALRRAARPLKRSVVVWDAPQGLQLDRVEGALTAEAARGDAEAAGQLQRLRQAPAYLTPPCREPPDLEAAGRVYPAAKSGDEAGEGPRRMQGAAAAAAWRADEREGLAFSAAAAAVRAGRVERRAHAHSHVPDEETGAAGGLAVQRVRAAVLRRGSCGARVAAVAEGQAPFAAEAQEAGGAPRMHSFRLLALARQRDRSAEGGFARHGAEAAQHSGQDGSLHGKPSASKGVTPSRSAPGSTAAEAASAQRLGLRPGGGSALLEAAAGALPRIPDLIGLLGAAPHADADPEEPQEAPTAAASGAGKAASGGHPGGAAHGRAAGARGSEGPARQRPPGTAWRDGLHMTIPMTTLFEVDPETGQVERVTTHWNGYIAQVLGGWQDARDVYTRQIRLQELMGRPGFRVAMQQGPMQRVPTEVALTVPRQTA